MNATHKKQIAHDTVDEHTPLRMLLTQFRPCRGLLFVLEDTKGESMGETMVYLIGYRNPDAIMCKIGYSKCPMERKNSMQTGNPRLLELFAVADTENDRAYERCLHHKWKRFHEFREWFQFPETAFLCVKQDMLDIEDPAIEIKTDIPFTGSNGWAVEA